MSLALALSLALAKAKAIKEDCLNLSFKVLRYKIFNLTKVLNKAITLPQHYSVLGLTNYHQSFHPNQKTNKIHPEKKIRIPQTKLATKFIFSFLIYKFY